MTITAVFGVDDSTTAILDCQEAGDIAALVGANIVTATMPLTEGADGIVLSGAPIRTPTMELLEAADVCVIFGPATGTIAATEAADNVQITATAPTSIISHNDPRFGVRVPKTDYQIIVERTPAEV